MMNNNSGHSKWAGNRYIPDNFLADESGMGTIEVILIIVVLVGLVLIFKKQLSGLIQTIFQSINSTSTEVTQPMSWAPGSGVPMV